MLVAVCALVVAALALHQTPRTATSATTTAPPTIAPSSTQGTSDAVARACSATVLVRVIDSQGRDVSSASGFLARRDEAGGYVVTAAHAVDEDDRVQVVFSSGTFEERLLDARVVAVDDQLNDLSILRIDAEDLPAALDASRLAEPSPALAVHVLGFPFGDTASAQVAVMSGTVTRLGAEGGRRLWIDADVQPGSSGGPVIDGQGRLVGVVTARVAESRIGLAAYGDAVRLLFEGFVRSHEFRGPSSVVPGEPLRCRSAVTLVDPLARLARVSVVFARRPAGEKLPEDRSDGEWKQLFANMVECPLTREGPTRAAGTYVLEHPGDDVYVGQIKVNRVDGTSFFLAPVRLLDRRTTPAEPSSTTRPQVGSRGGDDRMLSLGFVLTGQYVASGHTASRVGQTFSANGPFVVVREYLGNALDPESLPSCDLFWLLPAGDYADVGVLPPDAVLLGAVRHGRWGQEVFRFFDGYPTEDPIGSAVVVRVAPQMNQVVDGDGVFPATIPVDREGTGQLATFAQFFLDRRR